MKTKAERVAVWLVSNALFAASLWAGFAMGIPGAQHVAVFYVWFCFVGSLAALSQEVRKKMRDKGPPVSRRLDGLFDAAVITFLAWNGNWVLATAYILHSIFIQSGYQPEHTTEKLA